MPTHATAQSRLPVSRAGGRVAVAALVAGLAFPAALSALPSSSSPTEKEPARVHRHAQAKPSPDVLASQTPAAPEPPPVPPKPNWPMNDKPAPATVVWDSNGLRIDASNSSLDQILKEVSTDTGTKVEGLRSDQRIFGTYGPGPARDVLSQLLDGTGYNVLMIGDQGQGTPRQIVLSEPTTSPAPANNTRQTMSEEDYDAEQEIRQQEMEQQQLREQELQRQQQPPQPNVPNGFPPNMPPGGPPRTPQQIIQQMQLEQQQQQRQNNQQR